MTTDISVIIPAYNRGNLIGAVIDSVLRQQGNQQLEILVVDDASQDDLASALAPYAQAPLRLIRHEQNQGAAAARNTGLREASGRWIAFLDSDDTWTSDKLVRQMAFLAEHNLDAACTGCWLENTAKNGWVAQPPAGSVIQGVEDLVWGCHVCPGSTLMMRREMVEKLGPQDAGFGRLEDWDWLLRMARISNLGYLNMPLAYIQASGTPPEKVVMAGLQRMEIMHMPWLSTERPDLIGHFKAGLWVERAAVYYRSRQWGQMALALARSLSACPRGNKAIQQILQLRLSRKLISKSLPKKEGV